MTVRGCCMPAVKWGGPEPSVSPAVPIGIGHSTRYSPGSRRTAPDAGTPGGAGHAEQRLDLGLAGRVGQQLLERVGDAVLALDDHEDVELLARVRHVELVVAGLEGVGDAGEVVVLGRHGDLRPAAVGGRPLVRRRRIGLLDEARRPSSPRPARSSPTALRQLVGELRRRQRRRARFAGSSRAVAATTGSASGSPAAAPAMFVVHEGVAERRLVEVGGAGARRRRRRVPPTPSVAVGRRRPSSPAVASSSSPHATRRPGSVTARTPNRARGTRVAPSPVPPSSRYMSFSVHVCGLTPRSYGSRPLGAIGARRRCPGVSTGRGGGHHPPAAPSPRDRMGVDGGPGDPIVHVRDVFRTFDVDTAPVRALRGADLDVAAGEFVAITGRRGAASRRCCRSSPGSRCPTTVSSRSPATCMSDARARRAGDRAPPRRRRRLPVLQPARVDDGRREHRGRGDARRGDAPGGRAPGPRAARPARAGRQGRRPAAAPVRRSAPAPGDRPGDGELAGGAAGRRADGRPRHRRRRRRAAALPAPQRRPARRS